MAITDKTLIPLGLAVIAIGGGSMWLTSVYATGIQTRQMVEQIQSDRTESKKEYNKILIEINSRLARMEGRMEIIERQTK